MATEAETVVTPGYDQRQRFMVAGREYEMKLAQELSYADQINVNKVNMRMATLREFMEVDDPDEEVPDDVIQAWVTSQRRLVRIGFPDIPTSVLDTLAPQEMVTLANSFVETINTKPTAKNSRVYQLTNPTPPESLKVLHDSSDSIMLPTQQSGLNFQETFETDSLSGQPDYRQKNYLGMQQ